MGVHLREKQMSDGKISYYLDIYHKGTRWYEFLDIHVSKKHPTEDDKEKKRLAKESRTQREHELTVQNNGLINKKKSRVSFVNYMQEFLDSKNPNSLYICVMANLRRYAGQQYLPITAITPEWIGKYKKYLLQHVSNNTARSYLMELFFGLEKAATKRIIPVNPFRLIEPQDRIKKQDVFRTFYSIADLQKLASTACNINPQYRQIYFFSCFTGLRWSDVNCLMWSEIIIKKVEGYERYYIYFEQEKTDKIEYLPLSQQAATIIEQRKKQAELSGEASVYVFPEVKETDLKYKIVQRRVNDALKRWAKAAGLDPKNMHFHSSRHSFATNVLLNSKDGDLLTVSKLLGHKSIQSTQIYAHITDERKAAAVNDLPTINFNITA